MYLTMASEINFQCFKGMTFLVGSDPTDMDEVRLLHHLIKFAKKFGFRIVVFLIGKTAVTPKIASEFECAQMLCCDDPSICTIDGILRKRVYDGIITQSQMDQMYDDIATELQGESIRERTKFLGVLNQVAQELGASDDVCTFVICDTDIRSPTTVIRNYVPFKILSNAADKLASISTIVPSHTHTLSSFAEEFGQQLASGTCNRVCVTVYGHLAWYPLLKNALGAQCKEFLNTIKFATIMGGNVHLEDPNLIPLPGRVWGAGVNQLYNIHTTQEFMLDLARLQSSDDCIVHICTRPTVTEYASPQDLIKAHGFADASTVAHATILGGGPRGGKVVDYDTSALISFMSLILRLAWTHERSMQVHAFSHPALLYCADSGVSVTEISEFVAKMERLFAEKTSSLPPFLQRDITLTHAPLPLQYSYCYGVTAEVTGRLIHSEWELSLQHLLE